ncbi:MAG TPA: peptide ABC transporter substrate-binding protein, partial [Gammaproteobacteria bacterium]|nr:peptide ABC transporter substrate-binding protein [Gammaproteobacteria bacterium]
MSDPNHKIGKRLLTAMLVLLASACGLNQETNIESGNRDQILHVGNGDEPQELDPHVTTGIPEFHVQHTLFEGLIAKNQITLAIEPGVAETWEVS